MALCGKRSFEEHKIRDGCRLDVCMPVAVSADLLIRSLYGTKAIW